MPHVIPAVASVTTLPERGRLKSGTFDIRRHGGRTRELSFRVAAAMGVLPEVRDALALGACLHDIGKSHLPRAVVMKNGPLTESEWELIRTHPALGEEMLKGIDFLAAALPVIRHHHERWDGSGYPDGLRRGEIPLAARIVAVADAFDAMVSDRPYREALSLEDACEEIAHGAGSQLDPQCAEIFVELISFSELTLGGMLPRRPPSDPAHLTS